MRKKSILILALLAAMAVIVFSVSADEASSDAPVVLPAVAQQARSEAAPVLEPKGATGPAQYIVQFTDAPVASYRGGVAGLPATNPASRGQVRLDLKSPDVVAYASYLDGQRAGFLSAAEAALGRSLTVKATYAYAFNGVAIELTPAEARQLAKLPGVRQIQREFLRYPQTDYGPAWIGAPSIWDGSATGGLPGTMGEGVVVGVIDTGQNLDHPSFAEVGPVDGYVHVNPLGSGNFLGLCASDPGTWVCNDKFIGYYIFTGETTEDTDGHGSHTASTSAGNVVTATLYVTDTNPFSYEPLISGVAPHANIIGYDACDDAGGCPLTALTSSIEQTVLDGVVNVINYSIGGGTSNPWSDSDALAFLGAQDAGIVPVSSAGNSGPGAATIGSPADAPWMIGVGASTHNRSAGNLLMDMAGGDTPPPADIAGQSLSVPYGPAPIVYAGDFGDAQCLTPFPAGTWTSGEIVVCDRGTIARVAKGQNVLAGGAGGFVLANTDLDGESVVADPHVLPAIHIPDSTGDILRAWLASGTGHMATIQGTVFNLDPSNGDIMAGFSSRGPNVNEADVIKPDVTAPGVSILAAYRDQVAPGDVEPWMTMYNFVSGTSMSSPHTAGAAALMVALHPDWSPAEIKSALMSAADPSMVVKEDGVTPADPFDMGAGRVALGNSGHVGLVWDIAPGDYQNADPGLGGDPRTLNMASLSDRNCVQGCTWNRTVTSVLDSAQEWNVTTSGAWLTVEPTSFMLDPGASQVLTITADATGLPVGDWSIGEVTLTPASMAAAPAVERHPSTAVVHPAAPAPAPAYDYAPVSQTREPVALEFSAAGASTSGAVASTPDAPVNLIIDDGSRENSVGLTAGGQFIWLNRFTPGVSDYPFCLNEVDVLFGSAVGVNVGEVVDIYVYSDTDGDGDPGTGSAWLGSINGATVQFTDDVNFSSYPVPGGIDLSGPGDVLIAVVNRTAGTNAGEFPAALDQTATAGRSWVGIYSAGNPPDPPPLPADSLWGTIDSFGIPGNWMVRGLGETGTCSGEPVPNISLDKTVGTDSGACATTDSIVVPPGTDVTYCYTVTNTGTVTLTLHDLVDDQLGTIFTALPFELAPGWSAWLTQTATINSSTTNTGTWTAYNPGPSDEVTAEDTATVLVSTGELSCNTVEPFDAGIPSSWTVVDNEGTGMIWTNLAGCGEGGNFTGGSGDLACSSSDIYGVAEFDTELITPPIDLSGWSSASLDYLANYQNLAFLDFLDVDVSTDGGGSWTNLLSWNEDHGGFRALPGEAVNLDLTPYTGNSNVMLRWHYYDPNTSDWDWYAQVDDISLTCSGQVGPAEQHMPVALVAAQGNIPESMDIWTRRNAGSQDLTDLQAIEITDLTIDVDGMVLGTRVDEMLSQDPSNGDPYDNLNDGTVFFITTTVPSGASRLVAEITDSEAPDMDLYVGTGDTPSGATEVCSSTTSSFVEYCNVDSPAAGTWWILVQNWAESADPPDAVTLYYAAVPGDDSGNMWVVGPSSVPAGTLFDLSVYWYEPSMMYSDRWYAAFSVGSDPGNPGNIGKVAVDLMRHEDDVTKGVSSSSVAAGETVTYTITVETNVTPSDLTYWITDTIPAGMTYVDGSAWASSGTVTVTGNVLNWTGSLPTPANAEGDYILSTSDSDPSCAMPLATNGAYIDLAAYGIFADPGISGDTFDFFISAGTTIDFYGGTTNGNIHFTDDGFAFLEPSTPGGTPWVNTPIPTADEPNSLMAMLWRDLEVVYDGATNRGVTLASLTSGGTPVASLIEYDDVEPWPPGSTSDRFDFEVLLAYNEDPTPGEYEIIMAYDNLNGDLSTHTIGVENPAGTKGTQYSFDDPAVALSNEMAICYDYVGASLEPVTITYQASVDAGQCEATLTNDVMHDTDNPGSMPGMTSADVTVTDVCPAYGVDLTPDSDSASGDVNTSVVYNMTVTNTGNMTDTIDIAVSGNAWTTTPSITSATLGAGGSAAFDVTVDIPAGAEGTSDTATVTATSATDGSATDASTLTTTANEAPTSVSLTSFGGGNGLMSLVLPLLLLATLVAGATLLLRRRRPLT